MPDFLQSDVVVAGAGVVGAAFALELKAAVGDLLSVTLCDPSLARDELEPGTGRQHMRAVAIATDTADRLERLGVWAEIAPQAQPIERMEITDSRIGAQPNPTLLHFDPPDAGRPLAFMVFVADLHAALLRAGRRVGVARVPQAITATQPGAYGLDLTFGDGAEGRTRLLAAADGGRSRLRHAAHIQSFGADYTQAGIVATLRHSRSHHGCAVQHFLPSGPIALLPMRDDAGAPTRTSLVWTERRDVAERMIALAPAAFVAELESRIGTALGSLTLEDKPSAHPLRSALSRTLTGPRLALLGDAARTIHPLAGQGLNLGLRDAAALTAEVAEAAKLGLDPGGAALLSRYETARRFETVAMAAMTDALNRLFSNDRMPLRALRDVGLGLVDRFPAAKDRLMRQAGGRARA